MKKRHQVALMIICVGLFLISFGYREALTPYVSFAKARATVGTVQVKGILSAAEIRESAGLLTFSLADGGGDTLSVAYRGIKPQGIEQAESIVAIGRYIEGRFVAERLLVKCPSKYQRSVK